jgi:hypothetical protein
MFTCMYACVQTHAAPIVWMGSVLEFAATTYHGRSRLRTCVTLFSMHVRILDARAQRVRSLAVRRCLEQNRNKCDLAHVFHCLFAEPHDAKTHVNKTRSVRMVPARLRSFVLLQPHATASCVQTPAKPNTHASVHTHTHTHTHTRTHTHACSFPACTSIVWRMSSCTQCAWCPASANKVVG